uniref:Basic tail secreted protein n=1 Tax=Rhipicephalus zambeziensis TaxID=60191 RepID=A0A224YB12_9ACAR
MRALWMVLVSTVSTVFVTTQPFTIEYTCGPICPPQNTTMNSCVTFCPGQKELDEDVTIDIMVLASLRQGIFRNGTPCTLDDDDVLERNGEVGVRVGKCCGGDCKEIKNGTDPCKSMMRKCRFHEEVRLNSTILKKEWEKRRNKTKSNKS